MRVQFHRTFYKFAPLRLCVNKFAQSLNWNNYDIFMTTRSQGYPAVILEIYK